MQVAQLKLKNDLSLITPRPEEPRLNGPVVGEVALEIPTMPFADVAFALSSRDTADVRGRDEFVTRALNVVIAVVGLVLISPLILLVALAVKLTSRGPVLY